MIHDFPSAQPLSRTLPVLSLLIYGDYNIDEYQQLTTDKSYVGGHFYTDKAPLTTYTIAAVAFPLKAAGILDVEENNQTILKLIMIGALVCGTLPFVIIMTILALSFAPKLGASTGWIIAMFLCYGTNLFIYSGAVWGHLPAAAFLLSAHILLEEKNRPAWSGLMFSLAVATEYPLALAYAIYILFTLVVRKDLTRGLVLICSGIPVALLMMYYHYRYGGEPFTPLYAHVASAEFEEMKSAMGLSLPRPAVMWELLFGIYRGLLFYSPPLLFLAYMHVRHDQELWKLEKWKNPAAMVCCAHFLLISGYFMWWGGWCHGPRHLIPVLPLIIYLGRDTWCRHPFHPAFLLLASAGLLMNWVAKAVGPVYDESYWDPFAEYLLPVFASGKFAPWTLERLFDPAWQVSVIYIWPFLFVTAVATLLYLGQAEQDQISPAV